MTLSEQAASDENHKPDGQMELAFYAFWAWTNHPDEKFVLQAWEKIVAADSISLVAWRRVVERVLCRLVPSPAAEVVRLTDVVADKNDAIAALCGHSNKNLARAVNAEERAEAAERKLAEIHAIACGPWSECADGHEDAGAKRRMHLEQIATLSKEPSHG